MFEFAPNLYLCAWFTGSCSRVCWCTELD